MSNNNPNSEQKSFWLGEFGDQYISRNLSMEEVNKSYKNETGISVEEIFHNFFQDIDRNSKILELGCSVGLNLTVLRKMGFQNLCGLELNEKAIKINSSNNPGVRLIHSSIEEFDPKGETFDLVYTAGVLIHINPKILNSIIEKIFNLSYKFIFGFEYFSETLIEVSYRDYSNKCWKQNFPQLYLNMFPELQIVKEEKYHYKNSNLSDVAFLLKKH